jgi:hypothetical protein
MIRFEETCWLRLQDRDTYHPICEHTFELLRAPLLSEKHKLQGKCEDTAEGGVGWTKGPESKSSKLWGSL